MDKIKKTDHFYLIDGSGYIFRAYYALPPLTRKSDGLPVGAVSGFCSMLFKLLQDSRSDDNLQKPTHFAVIFDSARKNFRNEIYSDYKANRSDAPDDLVPQFEYIRKSVTAFNLPSVELINYEADDLIATYTEQILEKDAKVTIVSSDKDLMQLYKKNVRLYDPMKNKFITSKDVIDKFGVDPQKVVDVQSLAGDSSDNVPGVPGIGVKTAAELINKYGTLEKLLNKAHEIKQNKRRETIIENKDKAIISKKLVMHQEKNPKKHITIDSVREFRELTEIKIRSKGSGLFMIGGGVPKNFVQDTVICAELLGKDVNMHKYAVQITVADSRDGACSSSTLKEASSWGKVDVTKEQMVFAEATSVLPLIASDAYHKGDWKNRSRKKISKIFG